jgi:hypothetical protein
LVSLNSSSLFLKVSSQTSTLEATSFFLIIISKNHKSKKKKKYRIFKKLFLVKNQNNLDIFIRFIKKKNISTKKKFNFKFLNIKNIKICLINIKNK